MKIFIMTDMEGVAGVLDHDTWVTPQGRYYEAGKRLLTLEEAVRKMTSSTALKLRMKRKGFIMPGMDADMVVFGENRIRDVNTFENPRVYPEGIDYVLVNGEIAVDHGVHTGARPGKTIRD